VRRRPGVERLGRDGQPVAGRQGQVGRRRARAVAAGRGRQRQGRRELRAPEGRGVVAAAVARALPAAAGARAGAAPPTEGPDQAVISVPGPAPGEVGRTGTPAPGRQAAPTAGRALRAGPTGGSAALVRAARDGIVPSQGTATATTETGPGLRAVEAFLVAGTGLGAGTDLDDRARVGGTDRGAERGADRGDQTMVGSRGRTRRRDRDGDVR
jgi:hypothetical protein